MEEDFGIVKEDVDLEIDFHMKVREVSTNFVSCARLID